jgi:hypothetical protein
MDNKVKLYVNSTGNTITRGLVDLHGDEPIQFNISSSDIKDLNSKNGTYSQEFVIPGTSNNNILFNNIFSINIDCKFDPRQKTPCYLTVDSIPILKNGTLQLTGINIGENNQISYSVTIFDNAVDFNDSMGTLELQDLSFSALSHTWNYDNVITSWTGSSDSYFYSLKDYGYDYNLTGMNTGIGVPVSQMFADTQTKTIVDYIFSAAGFTYKSDFFNSTYFKNLYIPYCGPSILQHTISFVTGRTFAAQISSDFNNLSVSIPNDSTAYAAFVPSSGEIIVPYNDTTTPPNFDNGHLFDNSVYKYSADTIYAQSFYVNYTYEVMANNNINVNPDSVINIRFMRSSVGCFDSHTINLPYISNTTFTGVTNYTTPMLNQSTGLLVPSLPGELFWVAYDIYYDVNCTDPTSAQTFSINTLKDTTYFGNNVSNQIFPNTVVEYNAWIPLKKTQSSFFADLMTMHNLYVIPDKNLPKTLIIEPRNNYLSSGKTKDWSSKIDKKVPVDVKVISEQSNKRVILTYTADSDYYNDTYSTATQKIFGDSYTIINNDFVKDDNVISVGFSPTPSVAIAESSLALSTVANEFTIPKIGKLSSSNTFGSTNFKIRILQRNAGKLVNLNPTDYWLLNGIQQKQYPFIGMENHPSTATTSICFDQPDYEFYTVPTFTSATLKNLYWNNYLQEIANKDSKLVTLNLYLSAEDISNFQFNDLIYLNGILDEGGSYFNVNSITYDATSNDSSVVELFKTTPNYTNTEGNSSIANSSIGNSQLQSVVLAGATVLSTGSIGLGSGVVIGSGSNGSLAIGNDVVIGSNSPRSFVVGSGNTVGSGVQGAVVFGNNISAATNNTFYVPNIIISSGGSINGIVFSALTASTNLWSGSTGVNSIIANNVSGNIASGDKSFSIGNQNSSTGTASSILGGRLNYSTNYYSTVVNGKQNIASSIYSFIGNGYKNSISGTSKNNSILGGANNTIYNNVAIDGANTIAGGYNNINTNTDYSFIGAGNGNQINNSSASFIGCGNINKINKNLFGFIGAGAGNYIGIGATATTFQGATVLNGLFNSATTSSYSTVLNGYGNIAKGIKSLIGNGQFNSANENYSIVLNGNGNIAKGIKSLIGNGQFNSATTTYSTVINGAINKVTGSYSTIINGTQNIISGQRSTLINGSGITSSLSNVAIAQNYAIVTGGTNPSAGVVTLVGGIKTINTNRVTNSSLIFVTVQQLGGIATPVGVAVTARTAGTSFTITSASILDTSVVAWFLLEPCS